MRCARKRAAPSAVLSITFLVVCSLGECADPLLVRYQDALALVAEGDAARKEYDIGALTDGQLSSARQTLRQATNALESLDKNLRLEIPLRRRATLRGGDLTADELTSLEEQVQHQLGRASKCRGLLFDEGSDDRISLLLAAAENLQRLLNQLSVQTPLHANVQLELVECKRLLGRYGEAAELAAALDNENVAPEMRWRAGTERLRIALAQHDLAAASRLVEASKTWNGQPPAEWDAARFEVLLAFASASKASTAVAGNGHDLSRGDANRYGQQAATQADLLEKRHGSYWGRRANRLLIAAIPRGSTTNLDLLRRLADAHYLKGDHDQAIAAYDDAAAEAKTKDDAQAAFELAYKAALVEQKQGKSLAAARRLRALANDFATHPQAAQAHLLAAWNAGQEVGRDAGAAAFYEELLREQIAMWPASEASEQARHWLAKLEDARPGAAAQRRRKEAESLAAGGQRNEALDVYRQLANQHPDDGAIQQGYARLLSQSDNPVQLKLALDQWRIVASRTSPRTPSWFEAKYCVAQVQFKLGDQAAAATLLKFLLDAPPGMQGSDWEPAYRELLKKCEP